MESEPHTRFVRTDVWREGKWLDLWSVVHFLSGISVAFALSLLPFSFFAASVIAFLLLVAYELWEAMVQIHETPQNRVMDVVVGMLSFFLAHYVGIPRAWSHDFFATFALLLIVNIGLAVLGWRASQKAASLEKRMMERIRAQREKFHERRKRRLEQGRDLPEREPRV